MLNSEPRSRSATSELRIQSRADSGDNVSPKQILTNPRSSILNAGDIYNQKKIEREAMMVALQDENLMPQQLWYDSLRETDDGRFSSVETRPMSTKSQRPFGSTNRMFMIPKSNGLYSRKSIIPNQNRAGAISGEERYIQSKL